MGKLIIVSGRKLKKSGQTPSTLTYDITETDIQAAKCRVSKKEIIINKIELKCVCSGDYDEAKTTTFTGTGTASIIADTKRVKCEGQSILLKGDNVEITCDGTITTTSSGATAVGKAKVRVTIDDANQQDVYAGKV